MDFERKPGLVTGEPVPVRESGRSVVLSRAVTVEARMTRICLEEVAAGLEKAASRLAEEVVYVRRLIKLLPRED